MRTFNRICIKDYTIVECDRSFTIKRGKEYLTSDTKNNTVTVFSTMWCSEIPVNIFAGELPFTKD